MMGPLWLRRAARFARAVDPDPGAADSRRPEPDSETGRLVVLADRLRSADVDAAPSPEFRERLRAQLVDLAAAQLPSAASSTTRSGRLRRVLTNRLGRHPLVPQPRRVTATRPTRHTRPRLALAGLALSGLVAGSGLAVVISGQALPGDALYPVKRTTEGVELALVHSPRTRAERRLDFAQNRARELSDLLDRQDAGQRSGRDSVRSARPPDTPPAGDQSLLRTTLEDMDRFTTDGARGLTETAVASRSDTTLMDLGSWTADQRVILQPVLDRLQGDTADRAERSATLLDRITDRVAALRRALGCSCLTHGLHDDLGPLPCWPCTPTTTLPAQQASTIPPLTHNGGHPEPPTTAPTPTGGSPPATTTASSVGAPSGTAPPGSATPTESPPLLPPVNGEPTGGGLLPPILPTGVLPPPLPGLLPGLLGG